MTTLRVNMVHFKERFHFNEDTVKVGNHIAINKGIFTTVDARPYEACLAEFNIFYTISER